MRLSGANQSLLEAFEDSVPAYLSDITDIIVDVANDVAENNVVTIIGRRLNEFLDLTTLEEGFNFPSDRLPDDVRSAYCFTKSVRGFVDSDDCEELYNDLDKLSTSIKLLFSRLLPRETPAQRAYVSETINYLAEKVRVLKVMQEAYENKINQPNVSIYPEGGHRGILFAGLVPIVVGLFAGVIFASLPLPVFAVSLVTVVTIFVIVSYFVGPKYSNTERRLRSLLSTVTSSSGTEVSELLVQLAIYEIEIAGIPSSEERSKLVAIRIQKMIQDLNSEDKEISA